jgi:DNA-binding transcriptional regulator PaaX
LIKTNGISHYSITSKGAAVLSRYELKNLKISRPKRWDNKWRIIVFDIPERQKYSRDCIRILFKKIGLVKLQKSVWIYPFPCENVIELAKTNYHIRKGVIYFVCDRFSRDDKMAFNFGLGLNPDE